jgi:hypothetical protein
VVDDVCIDGVTEPQNASIISPIDTGMIEDDEGNMIPIQQTSPATLEPKPPDRAALITKFQRLRLGKLDCIRNEAVTRQLDQWARRTEAYNKHLSHPENMSAATHGSRVRPSDTATADFAAQPLHNPAISLAGN